MAKTISHFRNKQARELAGQDPDLKPIYRKNYGRGKSVHIFRRANIDGYSKIYDKNAHYILKAPFESDASKQFSSLKEAMRGANTLAGFYDAID